MQVNYSFVNNKYLSEALLCPLVQAVRIAMLAVVVCWGITCRADQRASQELKLPDSFESCVASGGRVQGERGERCTTVTEQVFEQSKTATQSACKDLCGDGTCQEIVCMAVGCPCPESATSCPADCGK